MSKLEQLEEQLKASKKFWLYATQIRGETLPDDEKIALAEKILKTGLSWSRGLAEENARKYAHLTDEEEST